LYNILAKMNFYIENTPVAVLDVMKNRFKSIRKSLKISQTELAQRSGVSFGSIKRFETTGHISMDSFLKLLHVLDKLDEMNKILQPGEDLRKLNKLFGQK
jgi:transcriptional regulator with XRE-family HTH domain